MKTGQKTTSGAVMLLFDNAGLTYRKLIVKAATANTGDMAVGNSNVNATSGFVLDATEQVEIDIQSTEAVYIFGAASHTATFIAVE